MPPAPSSSQALGVPDAPTARPKVSFLSRGWGYDVPLLEGNSRMAWAEAATPPVLGQGHPRLHLLISSSYAVGREAGGAAHIASLAAPSLEGYVGRCTLTGWVACICMLVCLWHPCLSVV